MHWRTIGADDGAGTHHYVLHMKTAQVPTVTTMHRGTVPPFVHLLGRAKKARAGAATGRNAVAPVSTAPRGRRGAKSTSGAATAPSSSKVDKPRTYKAKAATLDFSHLHSFPDADPEAAAAFAEPQTATARRIIEAGSKARTPTGRKPPAAGTLARRIIEAGRKGVKL